MTRNRQVNVEVIVDICWFIDTLAKLFWVRNHTHEFNSLRARRLF